ncbi:MAG: phosphatidylinositol-3-phosphate phosphatase [Marmoricola sp.]|jgi:hypothetical protein|nr:phosphatidylinositol-3-phosphate phosphatase [Marmoricola sp.]
MRILKRSKWMLWPAGALVTAMALAGCGSGSGESTPSANLASGPARASVKPITKLMVLVVENHSLSEMRADMPYLAALSNRYGYANHYKALAHPSLPNYLGIASGSTHGIRDDSDPVSHKLKSATVFGQAIKAGKTAKVYADGMPTNCALHNGGTGYAVRHNPWTYFVGERTQCKKHDVPLAALTGDIAHGRLPNAGMIVPNLCHDAHDCPLANADAFIKKWVTKLVTGPDWKAGRLAIVITADEDDRTQGNTILTTVVRPHQTPHVVTAPLNHLSLTRLYDDVLGVGYLLGARTAHSMTNAFHVPVAKR